MFELEIMFPLVLILWLTGNLFFYLSKTKNRKKIGLLISYSGVVYLMLFTIYLWINLERPPLRTLGETRLWYAFLVPLVGLFLYLHRKMSWAIAYSFALASIFVIINYLNPENFDKTLMPALQSVWFVPHVIVYMFAYSVLSVSMLMALKGLYLISKGTDTKQIIRSTDNIVYIGFAFLSFGLLFGAFWAKKAWGHYWTWDPKETWSFITWLFYLIYIHLRYNHKENTVVAFRILALAFIFLLICWFGINYLPSAQNSVHTYTS